MLPPKIPRPDMLVRIRARTHAQAGAGMLAAMLQAYCYSSHESVRLRDLFRRWIGLLYRLYIIPSIDNVDGSVVVEVGVIGAKVDHGRRDSSLPGQCTLVRYLPLK